MAALMAKKKRNCTVSFHFLVERMKISQKSDEVRMLGSSVRSSSKKTARTDNPGQFTDGHPWTINYNHRCAYFDYK